MKEQQLSHTFNVVIINQSNSVFRMGVACYIHISIDMYQKSTGQLPTLSTMAILSKSYRILSLVVCGMQMCAVVDCSVVCSTSWVRNCCLRAAVTVDHLRCAQRAYHYKSCQRLQFLQIHSLIPPFFQERARTPQDKHFQVSVTSKSMVSMMVEREPRGKPRLFAASQLEKYKCNAHAATNPRLYDFDPILKS